MDAAAFAELLKESSAPKGPEPGWELRLESLVRGEVKFREPLKKYTSIKVGGSADAVVFPQDREDLGRSLAFARENHVPWLVLGLGSNVLIKDGGIRGIVFRLSKTLSRLEVRREDDSEVHLEAEAGVPLPKIVELGRQSGFQGVEPLYGIPGSVGGAIWMNAGSREGEVKDCLTEIDVMLSDGSVATYPAQKLKFEYRHLRLPTRGIILSGGFCFKKTDPQEVQRKIEAYQKKRQETQPLEFPNLGSVFKNPEKGFAAQMIDELGLKGVRVGGARISEKHGNFIINEKGATARDVLSLIGLIRDKVRDELGVHLELEAKVLGEDE
jgi:UDP-N-acetylmuramate dehydrogenase